MPNTLLQPLAEIVGAAHVLTDADARAPYEEDATGTYRSQARAVVRPADTAQVAAVMRLAHETGTPVVPLGGNTGVSGGAWAGAEQGAILLSLERLSRIREIRPGARLAIVEAGVVLETLHRAVTDHGLIFPLVFGARGSCTIGGNLATNAGGSNVLRYGNTRALTLGVEVVTPDGRVMDLMTELHKDNTGYDLKDLYIGAEGTLGVITAAVLKLAPAPRAYATAMLAVPRLSAALDLLNRLQATTGGAVEAFEYMPGAYMDALAERFPDTRPVFGETHPINVLVEIGATAPRDAAPGPDGRLPVTAVLEDALGEMLEAGQLTDAVIAQTEAQRREIWARREAAYEVSVMRRPVVNNDIALPLDKVEPFLDRMAETLPEIAPGAEDITVGHLGDGNLHYCVWLDRCATPGDPALRERVLETVEDAVQDLGGTFSAEHGIGHTKRGTMARRKDPAALEVMRAIKAALDPKGIMNPGKVLP